MNTFQVILFVTVVVSIIFCIELHLYHQNRKRERLLKEYKEKEMHCKLIGMPGGRCRCKNPGDCKHSTEKIEAIKSEYRKL